MAFALEMIHSTWANLLRWLLLHIRSLGKPREWCGLETWAGFKPCRIRREKYPRHADQDTEYKENEDRTTHSTIHVVREKEKKKCNTCLCHPTLPEHVQHRYESKKYIERSREERLRPFFEDFPEAFASVVLLHHFHELVSVFHQDADHHSDEHQEENTRKKHNRIHQLIHDHVSLFQINRGSIAKGQDKPISIYKYTILWYFCQLTLVITLLLFGLDV